MRKSGQLLACRKSIWVEHIFGPIVRTRAVKLKQFQKALTADPASGTFGQRNAKPAFEPMIMVPSKSVPARRASTPLALLVGRIFVWQVSWVDPEVGAFEVLDPCGV